MKIRIADRILVAVAGLLLIALAAGVVAEAFFSVELTDFVGKQLAQHMKQDRLMTTVVVAGAAAVLALLGLYCLGVLVRHQKKSRRGFVVQQTDSGELSISIRAIEGLVQKCVDRHEEIHVMSTTMDTTRDGLVIKLRIGLAGGVNIPLAVSAVQKQIKQYVTSCSGVDVKEVKVQVETASDQQKESRYAVPDMPEKIAPLPVVEDNTPAIDTTPVETAEEKRPLHQRLFGRAEEPVTVPAPPVEPAMVETDAEEAEPAENTQDQAVEAMEETVAQAAGMADEVAPAVEEASADLPEVEESGEAAEEEAVAESAEPVDAEMTVSEDDDAVREDDAEAAQEEVAHEIAE